MTPEAPSPETPSNSRLKSLAEAWFRARYPALPPVPEGGFTLLVEDVREAGTGRPTGRKASRLLFLASEIAAAREFAARSGLGRGTVPVVVMDAPLPDAELPRGFWWRVDASGASRWHATRRLGALRCGLDEMNAYSELLTELLTELQSHEPRKS